MLHTSVYPVMGPGLDAFEFPDDTALIVVGDVHGQSAALANLLEQMGMVETPGKTRNLVFLGDLIDRGPDSMTCLDIAFNKAMGLVGADSIAYLPGNHELMLADTLEAAAAGPEAVKNSKAPELWLKNGGDAFFKRAFEAAGKDLPGDFAEALVAFDEMLPTPGPAGFAATVRSWPSHIRMGDVLCVHAGIAPKHDQAFTLDKSQQSHLSGGIHWAWLRDNFLSWQRGWPIDGATDRGALVLHGHTIPLGARARKLTSGPSLREVFCRMRTNGRICLDGGAAAGVGVAGAIVTSEGVKLLFSPV